MWDIWGLSLPTPCLFYTMPLKAKGGFQMDKETRFSSNNPTNHNVEVKNGNAESFLDNNDLNVRQRSDLRRNLKSDQKK